MSDIIISIQNLTLKKMKNILLLCAVIISISAAAQKISADKVPSSVMNAFKTKFPNAEKVKWEMEKKTFYEANFILNNTEQSATFDAEGKWTETETEIPISELPQPVILTMRKQFSEYKIKEAASVENIQHGHCFEVEIKKDKEIIDVFLNSKGEVLSKETENTGKDNKEDKD